MKKRILFTFGILTFITFIFVNFNVYAETTPSAQPSANEQVSQTSSVETQTPSSLPTVEDIEDSNSTNNVTLEEQLSDFANKWGNGIISALLGMLGSGAIITLSKGVIKKLTKKISDNIEMTEEEKKKAIEDLEKAKNTFDDNSSKFQKNIEDIKTLIPNMTKEFNSLIEQYKDEIGSLKNTVETLTKDFSVARELIAILISQHPELAKSGVATEILNVLSGKDVNINE